MASPLKMLIDDEEMDPQEREHLLQGGPQFGPKLIKMIDADLADFNTWMRNNLGGECIGLEKQILRTYAYWKLTKGNLENAEKKVMSPEDKLKAVLG